MVVVDGLDERLDLGSLLLSRLGHASGDLGWVALNTGDESMAVGVELVATVYGLDDDDLWDSWIRKDVPNSSPAMYVLYRNII